MSGYAANWRDDYEYVLLIESGANTDAPRSTRVIRRGSYFRLFKIDKS